MKHRNDPFVCDNCGAKVKPHATSSRNHCTECLHSKHLDLNTPGDRMSLCKGLMVPVAVEYNGKKGNMIRHKCEKCGKEMLNMVADDDNWDKIVELTQKM